MDDIIHIFGSLNLDFFTVKFIFVITICCNTNIVQVPMYNLMFSFFCLLLFKSETHC